MFSFQRRMRFQLSTLLSSKTLSFLHVRIITLHQLRISHSNLLDSLSLFGCCFFVTLIEKPSSSFITTTTTTTVFLRQTTTSWVAAAGVGTVREEYRTTVPMASSRALLYRCFCPTFDISHYSRYGSQIIRLLAQGMTDVSLVWTFFGWFLS